MRALKGDVKIEEVSVKQTWTPIDIGRRLEFKNGGILVDGKVIDKVAQVDKIAGIKNVKRIKLVRPS